MDHSYRYWYIWPFADAQNIHPYSDIAKLRGDWRAGYLHDEMAEQVPYFRASTESRRLQTGQPRAGRCRRLPAGSPP